MPVVPEQLSIGRKDDVGNLRRIPKIKRYLTIAV